MQRQDREVPYACTHIHPLSCGCVSLHLHMDLPIAHPPVGPQSSLGSSDIPPSLLPTRGRAGLAWGPVKPTAQLNGHRGPDHRTYIIGLLWGHTTVSVFGVCVCLDIALDLSGNSGASLSSTRCCNMTLLRAQPPPKEDEGHTQLFVREHTRACLD